MLRVFAMEDCVRHEFHNGNCKGDSLTIAFLTPYLISIGFY